MGELYLFILAMITWSDVLTQRIPDRWIVMGFMLKLIHGELFGVSWLAITIGFILLTRGGLGWGDVKLSSLLYMSGDDKLLRICLAFSVAAIFGVCLFLLKRVNRKSHLPMAPFLIFVELFFL